MRIRIALVMVAVLLMAPTASAHGANTFAFIMRNNSVQPDEASVQQNDTLIFYNVVDRNRTLNFSTEGKNGTIEWECETGPSNSIATDDECRVWLDPEHYKPTILEIQIFNNGSLWHIVNVTILMDNHTENGPPDGGFVLPGRGGEAANPTEDAGGVQSILLSGAILAFGAAACIWIMRNIGGDESNSGGANSKPEGEEE